MNRQRIGRLFILGALFVTVVAAALMLWGTPDPTYTVYADDDVMAVTGEYTTVAEVLDAAGLTIRPEDAIVPPLTDVPQPDTPIEVERARPVTIVTIHESKQVWTRQPTISLLLADLRLMIVPSEQIFADNRMIPLAQLDDTAVPKVLQIGRFFTVTVLDGANSQVLRTEAFTVEEVITELGITMDAYDSTEPPPATSLTPNMRIQILRATLYTIEIDGQLIQVNSRANTPARILAEAGIPLGPLDTTLPGPQQIVIAGETIHLIRISQEVVYVDEPISFEQSWQATDQLEIDQTSLLQAGVPGILRHEYHVIYENGVENGREEVNSWVEQPPQASIMGYGTNIVVRTIDTPEGVLEYWRVVRMRVTSYTAASSGKPESHPAYGLTYLGIPLETGMAAIDPKIIPLRRWVYVPGYGKAYTADTGGGVKGRWIDLGYSAGEYVGWSGYTDVYYLTPVPPSGQINYLLPTWLP